MGYFVKGDTAEYERHLRGEPEPTRPIKQPKAKPPKRYKSLYVPTNHMARRITRTAIRDGMITPKNQCEQCGQSPTQCHHVDYDKPLLVKWLCKSCHKAEHPELNQWLFK